MVFVMMGSMEKPKPRKKSCSYIAATGHKATTTSTSTSTTFGSCRSKQEDHNHEHDGQFHIVSSQEYRLNGAHELGVPEIPIILKEYKLHVTTT
ncbi:hypothetical protein FCV25MIE_16043 [Fagus crenata]